MATHVLVGNSAHMLELKGEMPQASLVSVDWLEACLARQCRISEAEYLFSKPSEGTSEQQQVLLNPSRKHSAIGLGDVQQALLWALAGETCPTWLNKQSSNAVSTVVLLMLPGMDEQMLDRHKERQICQRL